MREAEYFYKVFKTLNPRKLIGYCEEHRPNDHGILLNEANVLIVMEDYEFIG